MIIKLADWRLSPASRITALPEDLSRPAYDDAAWIPAAVPGTATAALNAAGELPGDPWVGTTLRDWPGFRKDSTRHHALDPIPADSSWREPVWYRCTVDLPRWKAGEGWRIAFDGINYRASLWVNGQCVADTDTLAGPFRRFDLEIGHCVQPGINVIAVCVHAQRHDELGLTFLDWGPAPPDDHAGLWLPVRLVRTGPVHIQDCHVVARPVGEHGGKMAVHATLVNRQAIPRNVNLRFDSDCGHAEAAFDLPPLSTTEVCLDPADFLTLQSERVDWWWPVGMGKPALYQGSLTLSDPGAADQRRELEFGFRRIESCINIHGARQFSVNGRELLIRGAAWCPDLLLRPSERNDEIAVQRVLNLGFNTIRFEGYLGSDYIWQLMDRAGILGIAGWPCCTHWEKWPLWKPGDRVVAMESLRSQLRRLRRHACTMAFFYGSDFPPPEDLERQYQEILAQEAPDLPFVSSAAAFPSALQPVTGVKMSGPYGYVPPAYWFNPAMPGRATSFNTETGPNVCVPDPASIRTFLPPDQQYPGSPAWNFHCGLSTFQTDQYSQDAIEARFGTTTDLDTYCRRAFVLAYDSWRSMYEAYALNYPAGTGVIGWMLNSAWPSFIWQLYDCYQRPNGAYWGSQQGCQGLTVVLDHHLRRLALVCPGDLPAAATADRSVKIRIERRALDGHLLGADEQTVRALPGGHIPLGDLPRTRGGKLVFLFCYWESGDHKGRNVYWLPPAPEVFDKKRKPGIWFSWTLRQTADYRQLDSLPPSSVRARTRITKVKGGWKLRVELREQSGHVGFFVQARLRQAVPVFWNQNAVTLAPRESLVLEGFVDKRDCPDMPTADDLLLDGWNVSIVQAGNQASKR